MIRGAICGAVRHLRTCASYRAGLVATVIVMAAFSTRVVRAQNDWQYPDPYFGIIEIEKSRTSAPDRRYRADVQQSPVKPTLRRPRWAPRKIRPVGSRVAGPR
jgi:hypothetical protein